MTPEQMRAKSAKHLQDARGRLAQGDFDAAAYDAGFAAELALKARYCSRNGLAALPNDKKTLEAHKLNTHKLEELLRLSQSVGINLSLIRASATL